jgi:hypothetical protein
MCPVGRHRSAGGARKHAHAPAATLFLGCLRIPGRAHGSFCTPYAPWTFACGRPPLAACILFLAHIPLATFVTAPGPRPHAERGYGLNGEESEPGVVAVAAPVRDHRRRVIAACPSRAARTRASSPPVDRHPIALPRPSRQPRLRLSPWHRTSFLSPSASACRRGLRSLAATCSPRTSLLSSPSPQPCVERHDLDPDLPPGNQNGGLTVRSGGGPSDPMARPGRWHGVPRAGRRRGRVSLRTHRERTLSRSPARRRRAGSASGDHHALRRNVRRARPCPWTPGFSETCQVPRGPL